MPTSTQKGIIVQSSFRRKVDCQTPLFADRTVANVTHVPVFWATVCLASPQGFPMGNHCIPNGVCQVPKLSGFSWVDSVGLETSEWIHFTASTQFGNLWVDSLSGFSWVWKPLSGFTLLHPLSLETSEWIQLVHLKPLSGFTWVHPPDWIHSPEWIQLNGFTWKGTKESFGLLIISRHHNNNNNYGALKFSEPERNGLFDQEFSVGAGPLKKMPSLRHTIQRKCF